MKNVNLLALLFLLVVIGCKTNTDGETEKHQKYRDHIINVKDQIIDINTDIFFGNSALYILDDILIVSEIMPNFDKGIHLFNKNTFRYITSTAIIGKGPGEVVRPGKIGVDYTNRLLWLTDHGKKLMWKFPLDSVLNNERYNPTENVALYDDLFLVRFGLLNDSIALGKGVHAITNSTFDMATAKFNLNTNVTEAYGYEHPEAIGKKSNSQFKLSVENNFYVNCYGYCDLMTICDLDGKLKYNVYGRNWLNKDNKKSYFAGVDLYNKHIVAAYNGDENFIMDEHKRLQGNLPSKFLVFDLEGNYKETIETGFKFTSFCVDEENKRLIVYFDGRENPLGYINLNFD